METNVSPNPGSNEAIVNGCTCAVLDNNHGRFPLYYTDEGVAVWYITVGCPLHTPGENR